MIEPYAKDDAFLASLEHRDDPPDGLRIWWLGQSGFLLRHSGSFLLFDPYLSDSLTEKYAQTPKPHVRMTARVVDPALLQDLAVITSSHNHTDHLDAATLRPMFAKNPGAQFIIPEANREFVAGRLSCEESWPIGVADAQTVTVAGWQLTGIAAAHNTRDKDSAGRDRYLGYIVRRGPWTIYHSGDTLRYPGLAETLADHAVDVAFLPINGNRPERGVAGNLNGLEAAQLASEIGARLVIPHHYEMFEFNTADPRDQFIPECERLAQPYRVLRAGESCVLSPD